MGIMVRGSRSQQASLMEPKRSPLGLELEPEPQLPSGWEKCLDMKSGLIYFKDWNTGTQTYRDPRQSVAVNRQRIGLLSISLSHEALLSEQEGVRATVTNAVGSEKNLQRRFKRKMFQQSHLLPSIGLPLALTAMGQTTDKDSSDRGILFSVDEENDQSLNLSLDLPGMKATRSPQELSVCTVEKVRNALERSQWSSQQENKKRRSDKSLTLIKTLSTSLTLISPKPSSSRESNSPDPQTQTSSKGSSPSTSYCSSECFTSPSAMSYQGDDEEVQQPRMFREPEGKCQESAAAGGRSSRDGEIMVAVGCKSCLMYVMLPKEHPSCPKCGNKDVLLELPIPMPKKQRMDPTWSWSTALKQRFPSD